MSDYYLLWNPDTGRCHGVKKIPERGEGIRITAVPKGVTLAEVCILVEKRLDIRQRGEGTYEELLRKTPNSSKLKKAG